MKDKVNKFTKQGVEAAQAAREQAEKLILAGIGVVSRVQKDGLKAFEAFIKEGTRVEHRTMGSMEDAVSTLKSKVKGRVGKAERDFTKVEKVFQERVGEAFHRIGLSTAKEVEQLTRRVDELAEKVQAKRPARRPARRPKATRARKAA
jgi:poly(hydroxyalkanoate) granule-associated protein